MQPRLVRSRSEVIVAGVCGGLAEYFVIDPVIVRLIFVLVTLTSGIGLLVYPILWLVMPKAGAPAGSAQQLFPQDAEEWRRRAHEFGEEAAQVGQHIGREVREVLRREQPQSAQSRTGAPPKEAYKFDPLTGLPIEPPEPAIGQTVNLRVDPTQPPVVVPPAEASSQFQQPYPYPPAQPMPPRKRWRSVGIILLAVGALILADQFGVQQFLFPLLMIAAGILLLRRR